MRTDFHDDFLGTVTLTWEAPRQLPGSWIAALCADDLAVLEVTIGRKRAST